MDWEGVVDQLSALYRRELPFVAFSQPGEQAVRYLAAPEIAQLKSGFPDTSCFVFAPYDHNDRGYVASISGLRTVTPSSMPAVESSYIRIGQQGRDSYLVRVRKALEAIRSGQLDKVVFSRAQPVALNDFRLDGLAKALFNGGSQNFRYLWFHPETGLWAGSTPETLLKVKSGQLQSMSLAGTRRKDDAGEWTKKEVEEQQYVTHYLSDRLKPYCQDLTIRGPFDQQAGNLIHLRTDLDARLQAGVRLVELVAAVHPTPAVCGTPVKRARLYIREHEGYERRFYTGYTGIVKPAASTMDLFVNLRCMQIKQGKALIYTGGGLTALSDPHAEWKETCFKQQAMLQLLRSFL